MLYRKKQTSYQGRFDSVKDAIAQFDAEGQPLVELPSYVIEDVREKYAWFAPKHAERLSTAKAVHDKIKTRQNAFKLVRQDVSHYMHSFKRAVERGWAGADERRRYFNLNPNSKDLGIPTLELDVVNYARMLLAEEAKRCQDGCRPIEPDLVDEMKDNLEQYDEAFAALRKAKNAYFRVQKNLIEGLPAFDEAISTLWNFVDAGFSHLPRSTRRQMSMMYGVRFVLRGGGGETTPTSEELETAATGADGIDPVLDSEIEPGQDPADDLGVERALKAAGFLEDADLDQLQNARGGASDANE